MPGHPNSTQQQHHQRSSRRRHRRQRIVSQLIEISKDIATSKVQVSITSDGTSFSMFCQCFRPIDTKIVLDPSVFGFSSPTVSSTPPPPPQPSSLSSPLRILSKPCTDMPTNPTVLDLPPPSSPLRSILLNMGMRETNRFEHRS
ncbi:unnamed protein product [Rotaria sp. Silwood2]|nr:unnamed protein product [Rotaria sp. Silwood2]CAF3282895.1 unnamed protein product [Rotaria sp. Silwood2]CAF4216729.1 unnamed protein product [Rotaria sp. Silwood2]CAF4236017.1 unnamed protein product [Rotaria sp. Silwood2]